MTTVLNTVIPILAGISFLGAVIYLVRGVRARSGSMGHGYGVARQEARQAMLVAFARAAVLFVLGLILLGVFGLSPKSGIADSEATPTAAATAVTGPTATVTVAPTRTAAATLPAVLPTASATAPAEIATDTPEPTEPPTTPTATVNSPNGLWLRERPGGAQELELIPDGTILTLLAGRETVDDLEWQQVRTPNGNEGWVAVEFIIIQ